MTMTETSTILDQFTGPDGHEWTLPDLGNDTAEIRSTRTTVAQPERQPGPIDEVRNDFEHWKGWLTNPVAELPQPEGHVTLRTLRETGATPPRSAMLLQDAIDARRPQMRGDRQAMQRQWAMSAAAGFTIPLADDQRTDEEKAAEARKSWAHSLRSLELLDDPDLRAWYLAQNDRDEVAKLEANAAEDADIDARPFTVTIEPGHYRCGITGNDHATGGIQIHGRGWVGDETHEVANLLVFSPVALVTSAPVGDPVYLSSHVATLSSFMPDEVAHAHALAARMDVIKDLITATYHEALPLLEKFQADTDRPGMPDEDLMALREASGIGRIYDAGCSATDFLKVLSGETYVAWLHEEVQA